MTPEELTAMQDMVTKAAEAVEGKLAASLDKVIEGINNKIELNATASAELQGKAKTAFETLPKLIQGHVESQLKINLTGIVEDVGKQFEERVRAMAGGGDGGAPGGGALGSGMSLRDLLNHSDKVIGLINAWKQPSTEQAMMGQMNLIFRWHGLLSKLEKGGGSGEDVTKAIADTFTQKEG